MPISLRLQIEERMSDRGITEIHDTSEKIGVSFELPGTVDDVSARHEGDDQDDQWFHGCSCLILPTHQAAGGLAAVPSKKASLLGSEWPFADIEIEFIFRKTGES